MGIELSEKDRHRLDGRAKELEELHEKTVAALRKRISIPPEELKNALRVLLREIRYGRTVSVPGLLDGFWEKVTQVEVPPEESFIAETLVIMVCLALWIEDGGRIILEEPPPKNGQG